MPLPRVLLPVATLAVGALGAMALIVTGPKVEVSAPPPNIPLVRVVKAKPQRYVHWVVTHGNVQPRTESEIVPEVSGRVEWMNPSFASGGFFDAEEALLRIDSGDYRVALRRARARLARAESELVRARREAQRQRDLEQRDVASAARLDEAVNAENAAAAVVEESEAALEQARRDLARTEIRGPFRGRVREERVDVGQFVSRGQRVATVYAVDFAEIRLPIPDAQLAFLDLPQLYESREAEQTGAEVLLEADFAGSRHQWRGYIVRSEGEIDPKTRMVHVVARVERPYARREDGRPPLAAGLFVEAEIRGREEPEAFVLPRAALRDEGRVLVVDAEQRLRWRDVDVLRVDHEQVVIGAGIEPGEQVCISSLEASIEGMAVRLEDEARHESGKAGSG